MRPILRRTEDLRALSGEIRVARDMSLEDEDEPPQRLEARERREAAQKLLEPLEGDCSVLQMDDELEICRFFWGEVMGDPGSAETPQQATTRMMEQLRWSRAFVASAWKL